MRSQRGTPAIASPAAQSLRQGEETDAGADAPGIGSPAMIRLPRGYAIVLGVVAAGLILLAYWIGSTLGYRRGVRDTLPTPEQVTQTDVSSNETPPFVRQGSPSVPTAAGTTGSRPRTAVNPVRGVFESGQDPRTPGLNYFVLAHYPRDEAVRLVEFLRGGGVEAAAIKWHNEGLFQVVALRGFSREELNGEGRKDFERRLRQLGQQWKSASRGANDLGDLYPAKYVGR